MQIVFGLAVVVEQRHVATFEIESRQWDDPFLDVEDVVSNGAVDEPIGVAACVFVGFTIIERDQQKTFVVRKGDIT